MEPQFSASHNKQEQILFENDKNRSCISLKNYQKVDDILSIS